MQYLERIDAGYEASLYEIRGEHQGEIKRYVVTTPETRAICNRPELLGVQYTHQLTRACSRALRLLPERQAFLETRQERICVVHFLRGGLNFGLRDALMQAFGLNQQSSAFMSSQRRKVDGRWQVEEDMYRKLKIPQQAVLVLGDVVATGITVDNGLGVIIEHLRRIGSSLRRMVFFTIGCHKLEKVLARYDAICHEAFDDFEGMTAIYFEGKFKLVDSQTGLRIGIPGTDLIRRDSLLAPEFAVSQYDQLCYPLERCTIYDAGSRAFDVTGYLTDVRRYWEQVRELGRGGMTLAEALAERWPEPWRDDVLEGRREAYLAGCREVWHAAEPDVLDRLWEQVRLRWNEEFTRRAAAADSLTELAEQRLRDLAVAGG